MVTLVTSGEGLGFSSPAGGCSLEDLHSAHGRQLQDTVMPRGKHTGLGGCRLSRILFFNVDRSITVTSLRALSTDRQSPVQVRKGLTITEKLLICSYWTAPTDPGT